MSLVHSKGVPKIKLSSTKGYTQTTFFHCHTCLYKFLWKQNKQEQELDNYIRNHPALDQILATVHKEMWGFDIAMSKNKQNNQHVHQQVCRDVLSKTATTVTAAHTEAELQQERSELGQFSMNEKLHENQTEVLRTKPTASFKSLLFKFFY